MSFSIRLWSIKNAAINSSTVLLLILVLLIIQTKTSAQVIEKNYLSTDKDIYAPKDTIWFKGYVFDRSNIISDQSIAYHVFLISDEGNKLADTSWPIIGGVTDGYLISPKYEGRFRIVATSGQMIGANPELAFSKDIFVRSELADEIEVLAFPQFKTFDPEKDNQIDIFTHFSKNAIAPEVKLNYQLLSKGKRIKKGKFKSSQKGKAVLNLSNVNTDYSDLMLIIESKDKRLTKPVKLALPIAVPQRDIDIQFFPEGGTLVEGVPNKVAFKAIDNSGKPYDFKGLLFKNDVLIDTVESFYQGMGSFVLIPEQANYTLRPQLLDSSYTLPKASNSGIALSLINKNSNTSLLRLIPHQNGIGKKISVSISQFERVIQSFRIKTERMQYLPILKEKFAPGIVVITVTNNNQIPLAERLIFVKNEEKLNVNIQTNKNTYQARGKVEANITVTDQNGLPVQGNFSVAVTDTVRAKTVVEQPNLLAQILLSSELKGHIPTPNFYFSEHPKSKQALGLIMMTNGWRKYTPSTIDDPEGISSNIYKLNSKRKPLNDRDVLLISMRTSAFKTFKTDKLGSFSIHSSHIKNKGDSILILSIPKNKKDKFSIIPSEEKRVSKLRALNGILENQGSENLVGDLKIFQKENKIRPDQFQNTILLNSVTVVSKRSLPKGSCELQGYHFEGAWKTKMAHELDKTENDIMSLIKQVSNQVEGYSNITMVNDGKTLLLYYDGIQTKEFSIVRKGIYKLFINCKPVIGYEPSMFLNTNGTIEIVSPGNLQYKATLDSIDFTNIESISIRSMRINRAARLVIDPVIEINTINDQVIYKPVFDIKLIHSAYENYTKEFYSPVYETEKQKKDPAPDLRTTIFWQANVFTDENGKATVTFYNADRPNEIGITIEGVDAYSRIGYAKTSYKVLEGNATEEKPIDK